MARQCRQRYSWNPRYQCHRRPVFGFCVEHWLDRCRWNWAGRWAYVTLDLSNMNRPYVQVDEDRPIEYVAVCYGAGNSDPVLMVELHRKRTPVEPPTTP